MLDGFHQTIRSDTRLPHATQGFDRCLSGLVGPERGLQLSGLKTQCCCVSLDVWGCGVRKTNRKALLERLINRLLDFRNAQLCAPNDVGLSLSRCAHERIQMRHLDFGGTSC